MTLQSPLGIVTKLLFIMSEIVFQPKKVDLSLRSEVENLQTTLASLNQRIFVLQEAVAQKDQEIADLKIRAIEASAAVLQTTSGKPKIDETLSIVGAAIKLFKFATSPGKVS